MTESKTQDLPSPGAVQDTIEPPYTPEERTRLVSDILNHRQESSVETPDWDGLHAHITSLSDSELDDVWNKSVGPWLLTREDLPRYDHQHIQELHQSGIPLFDGDGVVAFYQKFLRLSEQHSSDYGFLDAQTYHHQTDSQR
jgi:hypothetical protein